VPRTCTVCAYPERETIDRAPVAGEPSRQLAARCGPLSWPAIQRRIERTERACDKSDRSDKRSPSFTSLTVSEVLAEVHRWGSGAGKNADLYRRGELSEEKAVEYVTCAILARRRQPFDIWRHHAPAVRKALGLCIHELEPDVCKVCSGYVRRLIEGEGTA
jgi:hypothetical protein